MNGTDENNPVVLHVERRIYKQDDLNRDTLYAKPSITCE